MANLIWLVSALLVPLVWLVSLFTGVGEEMSHVLVAVLAGFAVVGAAFQLSWGCELAEQDIPPALALIILALVAVLPEYAVDLHFAWVAGVDPSSGYLDYAVANMTGANRVLIGVGWASLVIVLWLRNREKQLHVDNDQRLELGFLLIATLYSFVLPLKQTISVLDSAVFFGIFIFYVIRAMKSAGASHDLVGPARWIDDRVDKGGRWAIVLLFLVYACGAIWFSAHHFADSLVAIGKTMAVDEFILIQLVAPLASEAPEFIVAILFVIRHRPSTALAALVSSKVNQWTLLIGALPIAYSLARWSVGDASPPTPSAMELSSRQVAELLLTSAQSLFAVAVLADLRFTLKEGLALAGLFIAQWFFPGNLSRYLFAGTYLVLVLIIGFGTRRKQQEFLKLLKAGR
ncbi:MAG: sodium:calcium antiporter [Deltaproteobacteria bacterium]|nr:sodium:calcium antiporter [Deltaproteobacteria bacterium]